MTAQRVVIVTGAASGIGRATTERLMGDGWRVVGIDLRDEMAMGVVAVVGDAVEPEVIGRALAAADGRLDGLVCAAGMPPNDTWDDEVAWDDLLRVDLTGPYTAIRLCMPALEAGRGSVVVVGSILGGVEGSVKSPAYAAAKAGLEGLIRSMALVGAPHGVRANVVAPGAIDTPFDPPRFPADDRADVPLGRMGTAAEVAAAVCFLLSDDASYVTGTVLRVDGGRPVLPPGAAIRARGE